MIARAPSNPTSRIQKLKFSSSHMTKVKPGKSILVYLIYTSMFTILFECVINVFKIIHETVYVPFSMRLRFHGKHLLCIYEFEKLKS